MKLQDLTHHFTVLRTTQLCDPHEMEHQFEEHPHEIFHHLDFDGSGKISHDEAMGAIMMMMPPDVDEATFHCVHDGVTHFFAQYAGEDGQFDEAQFVAMDQALRDGHVEDPIMHCFAAP